MVAGAESASNEPRVAIVAANGQLRRLIELKGDVHGQHENEKAKPDSNRDPTALPRFASPADNATSLFDVVYTSQIANDGENLILFRPSGAPVFSVSPSGEVRSQRLKVDGDYRLFAIKSAENSWIVEFVRDLPNGAGEEFATYAFDPQSGAPLRQYLFPTDLGFGLACTDGNQFTFVIANDSTKTPSLVKLEPLTTGRD